jgi:hypothetical protein
LGTFFPLTLLEAFPPHHLIEEDQPVSIRDPWAGPQTYAEDYYSGGDSFLKPAISDPHFLGNEDITDFLTPGVLTPAKSSTPGRLASETPVIELEDDEDLQEGDSPPALDEQEGSYEEFTSGLEDRTEAPADALSSPRAEWLLDDEDEEDSSEDGIEEGLHTSTYEAPIGLLLPLITDACINHCTS